MIAERLLATLDPDGAEPRDERQYARRGFGIGKDSRGDWTPWGAFTDDNAAIWTTIARHACPLRNRRRTGCLMTAALAQRRHDGLMRVGQTTVALRRVTRRRRRTDHSAAQPRRGRPCTWRRPTRSERPRWDAPDGRCRPGTHRHRCVHQSGCRAAAGRAVRTVHDRVRSCRRGAVRRPHPPTGHPGATPHPGRPRRRLRLPRLHTTAVLVRGPSRDPVATRRRHRPRESRPALRVPPPRVRAARLDRSYAPRPPRMAATSVARPRTEAGPQHRPPPARHRLPQPTPAPCTEPARKRATDPRPTTPPIPNHPTPDTRAAAGLPKPD